jgi:hypothetical protein
MLDIEKFQKQLDEIDAARPPETPEQIMRRNMISAFCSYLNTHRGETVIYNHLELLTLNEREWFDMCIEDIKKRR